MNRNVARGIDAQPHFVAANIDDRNDDVVADHDALVTVSRQNQHRWLLPQPARRSRSLTGLALLFAGGGSSKARGSQPSAGRPVKAIIQESGSFDVRLWTMDLGFGPLALREAFVLHTSTIGSTPCPK